MKTEKIIARILIPLAVSITFLLVAFTVTIYSHEKSEMTKIWDAKVASVQKSLLTEVKQDAGAIAAMLDIITQNHELARALKVKDRGLLLKAALPIFQPLLAEHNITHLYFTGVDRVNILRVHKPSRHGDKINRFTTLIAEKTGKAASGIELGPLGTFTLRVVYPWFYKGKLIGYIEMGKEVDRLLDEIREDFDVQLFLFIKKDLLDRTRWQEGNKLLNRDGQWNYFSAFVNVGSSLSELPPKLLENLDSKKAVKQMQNSELFTSGMAYHIGKIPLIDAGGNNVGYMVLLYDETDRLADFRSMTIYIALICLAVGIGLIFFFYRVLRKIERNLQEANAQLIKEKQALSSSQESLKTIFEESVDGILLAAPDTKKLYMANERICQMLGYSMEELLQLSVTDFHPKEELAYVLEEFEKQVKGEIKLASNLPVKRKNGTIFYADINSVLINMDGNKYLMGTFRDVTKRKEKQNELEENEKRFRAIFENSNDAIFIVNPSEDKIINVNAKACEMLGYSHEALLATPMSAIHPDDINELKQFFNSVYKDGSGIAHGLHCLSIEKRKIPVEISASLIEMNQQTFMLATVHDVSIREESEKALAKSEKKFKNLFKFSSEAIMLLDDNGFVDCNDATLTIFGYDNRADFLGKHPSDTSPEFQPDGRSSQESSKEKIATAFRDGENSFEWVHCRADGEKFTADVLLMPAFIKGERVLQAIVRDITKRKQAEEEERDAYSKLKETQSASLNIMSDFDRQNRELTISRASLKKAQEISHIGNWEWNVATGNIYWSGELHRIFRNSPKPFDLNCKTILDFVHPQDKEVAEKKLQEALKHDVPYDMDHKVLLPNEGELAVHVQGEVIRNHSGKAVKMFGTVQDITERKKSEVAIIKAKTEAEDATALKDKFISLVSHDLRGPLGTMMGFITIALKDEAMPQNEGAKLILESALSSGSKMVSMIEDLLNISRLKTGALIPAHSFLDIYATAVSSIASLEQQAKNKGITLINGTTKQSRIYADKALITEVLQNLISNAIKFCSDGDSIRISASFNNERAVISVEDSGTGIAPEKLKKLFSYEEKTSTIGTAGEVGTGLGLPLSRDIMEAHGGGLTVTSTPEGGTVFYAELPIVKPLMMIVDDSPPVRDLHRLYLAKLNVDIIEAEDGVDALEKIKQSSPHLILTDINMPRMNGLELVKKLKADKRFAQIPIIAITSIDDEETRNEIISLGCDDFISKPCEPKDLLPRIRRFIS